MIKILPPMCCFNGNMEEDASKVINGIDLVEMGCCGIHGRVAKNPNESVGFASQTISL